MQTSARRALDSDFEKEILAITLVIVLYVALVAGSVTYSMRHVRRGAAQGSLEAEDGDQAAPTPTPLLLGSTRRMYISNQIRRAERKPYDIELALEAPPVASSAVSMVLSDDLQPRPQEESSLPDSDSPSVRHQLSEALRNIADLKARIEQLELERREDGASRHVVHRDASLLSSATLPDYSSQ
ncbi:hypothetical protein MKEN_01246400 [Mycena kentingensis (nom. inval.)]|nr:hypothetical protein MKEN_01246400 [Mycena kentingensis (nom. inval.)]